MAQEKRTRKNVPHFLIFDYWKDKVILSDGEIVEGKNKPDKDYEWVVHSNYEPCCWGCGLPAISKLEENNDSINENDLPLIWNDRNVTHKLQRCHIKPRSLGGEDTPDNLFLLCAKCHEESPDTTNSRTFFRWVYKQRKSHQMGYLSLKAAYELLQEEIKDRGLNVSPAEILATICEKDPKFDGTSIKEYMNKNVGQHGFQVTRLSIVAGAVDWMLHSYVETLLKD